MGLASMVFETKVRKHKNKGKTASRRRLLSRLDLVDRLNLKFIRI